MPYCRPRGHGKGHTPHCRQGRAHTALPSAQTGKACAAMPSTQARRTYAAMSVRFPCIDVHRWRQSICPLGQCFPRSMPARTGVRPSRPASAPQSHAGRNRRTPSQVSIPSPSRRRAQSFHHATVKVRSGSGTAFSAPDPLFCFSCTFSCGLPCAQIAKRPVDGTDVFQRRCGRQFASRHEQGAVTRRPRRAGSAARCTRWARE